MQLWRWLYTVQLRLRSLIHGSEVDCELDDEVRDHLESKTDLYIARGLSPEDARRAALRDFGGVERSKEECRDARPLQGLENLMRDFRHAARGLRKSAGFTAVATLILTLGIGANIAIFSMVNALLLHPYPYRDLDQLVMLWETQGGDEGNIPGGHFAPADLNELKSGTDAFSGIAASQYADFNLSYSNSSQPVRGCRISSALFEVLGVTPALGRNFSRGDEQPGADDVAIISYPLWRQTFAGDPAVIGKKLRLDGRTHTVIGVMPARFAYPAAMQVWVPLALSSAEMSQRADLSLDVLARLKPGVSRAEAFAQVQNVESRLQREYPATNAGRLGAVLELRKQLYQYSLPLFALLQAGALFVLLIAGANLANLLFARRIGRQKEIALRTALGAGRARIAFLFISETLLLTVVAGAMAIAVSLWTVKLLRTSISSDWTMWVPGWDAIRVDSSVLVFAVFLTVAAGILFGAATVLHSGGVDLNQTLKDSARGGLSPAKARVRSGLVILQVAAALVLLVCAGLAMQGFSRLAAAYQGFNPNGVLHAEIILPRSGYVENRAKSISLFRQVRRDAAALPSVISVGFVSNSPASNVDNENTFFTLEGRQPPARTETPMADLQTADAGFFESLHIPLVAGRLFADSDDQSSARVVLVSQSLARRFWPNGDALGHRVKLGRADSTEPWMTVVGVVSDVRQNWWNPVARPAIYRPYTQASPTALTLLVRTTGDPLSVAQPVREGVRRLEPDAAITEVDTLEKEVGDSIAIIRIMGVLMTVFGGVALALASVGVYGVLSESVAQRTREIGIRISLGADRSAICRLIFAHALKLAAIGLLIGVPVSFVVNQVMATSLYGIVPLNFALLIGFAGVLLGAAALAAYLPARHAMRIHPMEALRSE